MMPSYGSSEHQASILLKLHSHPSKFHITHHTWQVTQSLRRKIPTHTLSFKKASQRSHILSTQFNPTLLLPIVSRPSSWLLAQHRHNNCFSLVLIDFWLPNLGLGLDLWCFDSCIPVLYNTTQPPTVRCRHWFSFLCEKYLDKRFIYFNSNVAQYTAGVWSICLCLILEVYPDPEPLY